MKVWPSCWDRSCSFSWGAGSAVLGASYRKRIIQFHSSGTKMFLSDIFCLHFKTHIHIYIYINMYICTCMHTRCWLVSLEEVDTGLHFRCNRHLIHSSFTVLQFTWPLLPESFMVTTLFPFQIFREENFHWKVLRCLQHRFVVLFLVESSLGIGKWYTPTVGVCPYALNRIFLGNQFIYIWWFKLQSIYDTYFYNYQLLRK